MKSFGYVIDKNDKVIIPERSIEDYLPRSKPKPIVELETKKIIQLNQDFSNINGQSDLPF